MEYNPTSISMSTFQWLQSISTIQWLQSTFPILLPLFFLLLHKFLENKSTKTNLPPGPPKLPIIGNLHQLGSLPHISLYRLAQKYGPIMHLQLGHIPTVVISSPSMAKEVMKTHDLALLNRPQLFAAKILFYNCNDITFSPYGPYWRHIRKFCILELLSLKQVQSFGFVRVEEVGCLVRRISECYPNPVNLSKMFSLYANDVLCRVAFGREFSRGGDYDRHGFHTMLADYIQLLGGFSIGDFFPSLEFINNFNGFKSRLQQTFQRFDQFLDEVINEHLDIEKQKQKQSKDLLDVLLDIQSNGSNEVPLSTNNVKAIILDMFAAGSDSTYVTLDWAMAELLRHPKILQKAQSETRKVIGQRRVVSETELTQLHYMKAVIKETFRLHPPSTLLLPRESTQDIKLNGYEIPAKTRFYINQWAIGRDPKSWKNLESFEPERFLGSSVDFKGQHFEIIPFGAGRRICPGIAFGMASVELALVQLLHSFDWELPLGTKFEDVDMKETFGLTTRRTAGLMVIAKPRFI